MENPHDERQAILLERIVKNSNKCTELVIELNQCLEDIIRANHKVRLASQLAAKYRKNVEYNLKVAGERTADGADSNL